MAILSMLLVLALVPLYLWKRRQDNSQSSEDHREEQQAPQRENVVRGAATRRMRRRPASGASTSSVRAATVEDHYSQVGREELSHLVEISNPFDPEQGVVLSLDRKFKKT